MEAITEQTIAQNPTTQLAVDRTKLAHDRTLMAWLRTSASLISFGFTIYKFFQGMKDEGATKDGRWFGPREFALFLIGIGVLSLVLATADHRLQMKALRKRYFDVPFSMATIVAGLVGVFGLVCFLAVALKQ